MLKIHNTVRVQEQVLKTIPSIWRSVDPTREQGRVPLHEEDAILRMGMRMASFLQVSASTSPDRVNQGCFGWRLLLIEMEYLLFCLAYSSVIVRLRTWCFSWSMLLNGKWQSPILFLCEKVHCHGKVCQCP